MTGRGKSKFMRTTKAPRLSDHIPRNSFIKLARKAGIKSISGSAILEMRGVSELYLENLIKTAMDIKYASGDDFKTRRRRLNRDDIEEALHVLGLPKVYGSASKKKCKTYTTGGGKKVGNRRLHPGTKALREIKFYQKNSDCLVIAEAIIQRKVKKYIRDYEEERDKDSISKEALGVIREAFEDMMVKLFSHAQLAAIHAGRVKVMPKDIQIVRFFRGERG